MTDTLTFEQRQLTPPKPQDAPRRPQPFSSPTEGSILHVLIPAQGANAEICKTTLSTALLKYPAPVLLRSKAKEGAGGEIGGVLKYLRTLSQHNSGDLVLLINGFQYWFQLPPQILIDRYNTINSFANQDLRDRLGSAAIEHSVHQSIIFASLKNCYPYSKTAESCAEVLNIGYPEALFGFNLGYARNLDKTEAVRREASWLDTALVMGPAKDLISLFERAQELVPGSDSDKQSIFASIWSDQEHHRQTLTGQPASQNLSRQISQRPFTPQTDKQYDFGIGIDYANALLSPLPPPPDFSQLKDKSRSKSDLPPPQDFLNFSNLTLLNSTYKKHQIPISRILPPKLHADIALEALPFSSLSGTGSSPKPYQWYISPSSTPWGMVPLYTDLLTSVTPVMIPQHLHASNKDEPWDGIWFLPLSRKLLGAAVGSPEGPIAIEGKTRQGRQWFGTVPRSFFRKIGGFGVIVFDGDPNAQNKELELKAWMELCDANMQSEAFGDGEGSWNWNTSDSILGTDPGVKAPGT